MKFHLPSASRAFCTTLITLSLGVGLASREALAASCSKLKHNSCEANSQCNWNGGKKTCESKSSNPKNTDKTGEHETSQHSPEEVSTDELLKDAAIDQPAPAPGMDQE